MVRAGGACCCFLLSRARHADILIFASCTRNLNVVSFLPRTCVLCAGLAKLCGKYIEPTFVNGWLFNMLIRRCSSTNCLDKMCTCSVAQFTRFHCFQKQTLLTLLKVYMKSSAYHVHAGFVHHCTLNASPGEEIRSVFHNTRDKSIVVVYVSSGDEHKALRCCRIPLRYVHALSVRDPWFMCSSGYSGSAGL